MAQVPAAGVGQRRFHVKRQARRPPLHVLAKPLVEAKGLHQQPQLEAPVALRPEHLLHLAQSALRAAWEGGDADAHDIPLGKGRVKRRGQKDVKGDPRIEGHHHAQRPRFLKAADNLVVCPFEHLHHRAARQLRTALDSLSGAMKRADAHHVACQGAVHF